MRLRFHCWSAVLASAGLLAAPAHADLLTNLNRLRLKDCARSTSALPLLRRSSGLDAVAKEWSKGSRLTEALGRTPYRANKAASMQVRGTKENAKVAAALRKDYCSILIDARYSEVGLYQRDANVWIVVAAPASFPSPQDASRLHDRVLELVNQARSQPRKCGAIEFAAAEPVRSSLALTKTAQAHAQDMAEHEHFQHEGTDGSDPGLRATRMGYRWSRVAENIAAGVAAPEEAVRDWLASPGHCANIMQPQFSEMGVGYAITNSGKTGIYWSQVFAKPYAQ